MSVIDPYELATFGQNMTNTFTLGSNGVLVDIFITDLPDIVIPIEIYGGGIIPGQEWPQEIKTITRKKIHVVATINGEKYEETIIIEDRPNLKVSDIDVYVSDIDTKPKIKIRIEL